MSVQELVLGVSTRFAELFPGDPPAVALGPGRVNLIGEHTDYNDGWVLPMAIARHAAVAFRPRADRKLRAHSMAYAETREVSLDALAPPGGADWLSYVAGTAWAMAEAGLMPPGLDLVVSGDVPIGAGLSSSAALELASARAFCHAGGIPWDPVRMARIGQRAENRYVGVNCGLMDQMASAVCREGNALLLDCRTLETEAVPIPSAAAVVVMDTGARRSLAGSAYNERRASCEAAVKVLGEGRPEIRALRDVDLHTLESAAGRLDPVSLMRARHVVPENRRPLEMAAALGASDLPLAGRLMNDSHLSLRDLYQVSCDELDLITDLARRHPGCFGARMTGAGFGGCAVALVKADAVLDFVEKVHRAYRTQVDLPSAFFACRPEAGARLA
jgi:galactokinase